MLKCLKNFERKLKIKNSYSVIQRLSAQLSTQMNQKFKDQSKLGQQISDQNFASKDKNKSDQLIYSVDHNHCVSRLVLLSRLNLQLKNNFGKNSNQSAFMAANETSFGFELMRVGYLLIFTMKVDKEQPLFEISCQIVQLSCDSYKMHQSFSTSSVNKPHCQIVSSTISYNNPSSLLQQKPTGKIECSLSCTCQNCLHLGYTKILFVEDQEQIVYRGPIMVRLPVSNLYQMVGDVSLNYKAFHNFSLRDIVKMKATYVDAPPGLTKLILTIKPSQKREEITVNGADSAYWFINIIRAKLYTTNRFGVPLRKNEGKLLGKLWVKVYDGWKRKGVEITDRLRIEGQDQIKRIKQFWTRFQLIDVQGLSLVVKYWDFLTKWQIGIPLSELSVWLQGFLSLVKD